MELIAIMSRVRFSKQLERAILTQGLAHSQAQNVLTRKKNKTLFHTKAWPLATTCLPVELGHAVSLFAWAREHATTFPNLSQSFPSVDDITDQGSPGPMWRQVVPSCAKLCQVAQILLQRPFEGISIRESCSLNHGALPHVSHDMGSVGKSIQSQCTNTKQLQMSRNVQAWGAESLPIDGSCECEFTWCLSCSLLDILEFLDVEGDGTGT